MAMALDNQAEENRSRSVRGDLMSAKDLLEQAMGLAAQIEGLLTHLGREVPESDTFRVRLARAHTLSLLDQLSELLGPRPSHPPIRACAVPEEEDENAASGVRWNPIRR
jgi:hypothetical protein